MAKPKKNSKTKTTVKVQDLSARKDPKGGVHNDTFKSVKL